MSFRLVMLGVLAVCADAGGSVTVHQLTFDYLWGYRSGVKQPLGAYKNGLSVHQISKSNYPPNTFGNPDYLFWVDEIEGTFGIAQRPTGDFDGNVINPGGKVVFSNDGTLWYTYGGRAQDLAMRLYSSALPYDLDNWEMRVHDWDTTSGSTTPCVSVNDPRLMLFWRHQQSGNPDVSVRFRQYDMAGTFASPEIETIVAHSGEDETLGLIGIEQLWTRHDPRYQRTFLSWQYRTTTGEVTWFGSNPILYTDDDGQTWRSADGSAWSGFPILYTDINDVLVPDDHLARGVTTGWLVCELGAAPDGTSWTVLPEGDANDGNRPLDFWRFTGSVWESRTLADIGKGKPFACGVTRDYIVCLFAGRTSQHVLEARVSANNGRTGGDPVELDAVSDLLSIAWVSFVQPADGYPDNRARFFYGFYREIDGFRGRSYRHNIRWVGFDAQAFSPADLDGDGVVGVQDVLKLLTLWG
ncbi:MAG: hypothetical protein ACYSU7_07200 [Planctomycetota bacterium]|jgi:hypothetical protein